MSFENPQAEQQEPSFEEKNTALANEWPRIMVLAGESRDVNGTHHTEYGVDEGHSYKSEARGMEGVLESGVTPKNHEVAAALKGVIDAENALDELRQEQADEGYHSEEVPYLRAMKPGTLQTLEEAKESLRDAVAKHQPAVTGAY
jgi:hypothetical protein